MISELSKFATQELLEEISSRAASSDDTAAFALVYIERRTVAETSVKTLAAGRRWPICKAAVVLCCRVLSGVAMSMVGRCA